MRRQRSAPFVGLPSNSQRRREAEYQQFRRRRRPNSATTALKARRGRCFATLIRTERTVITSFLAKGERLAAHAAFPSTVVSLILSDIVGDALDLIARRPTVPDGSSWQEASDLIDDYGLGEEWS